MKVLQGAENHKPTWLLNGALARVRDVERREHQYRAFAKYELVKMLKMAGFTITTVKERACYLPGSIKQDGFTIPLAGAYVALVTKPAAP